MKLFYQINWYFIKEWKRYIGSTILLIIISILQLLPPKLVGILIDSILNKQYNIKLYYWISIIILTSFSIYILRYIWRILLFGAAYQLAVELRVKIYSYLSKKNTIFYLNHRTGDLMARATSDVDRVVFAAGEGVLTLVDSLITGCSVLIIMITQINLFLTIVALLPMPIMAIIITKFGKQLHYAFKKSQASFSQLNNQTQESLTNIHTIKGFGLEQNEMKKFKTIAKYTSKKHIQVSKIDAKFDPTIHSAIVSSNLLAITFGSLLVWKNIITLGQLTSFMMYLGLMIWPTLALAWMFNILERGGAAWNRIQSIINKDFFIPNGNQTILDKHGKLIINILKFKFPNHNKTILKNISIKIDFNQIIGLCGPTGSGKSTLLNLIQGNFNIIKGDILYNKSSISNFKNICWKKKISVVNQNTILFSNTIKNNITLGHPNASQNDIEYVAKLANIHQDIINFPDGYHTHIGERGIMLSGGQKQRISIARALLLQSEILILDDALSAIDGQTQNRILKNIKYWKKNKHTIILTSHKLSIFNQVDNIFILDNGSIVQSGTHKKLMQYNNWYNKMYNQQKLIINY
ncbi:ABC transporter transmembrane domain-containing protein [Buchnera aphidicola]|uniref:Multidrug resistance-like ATP-binding protein MdlA n=1 Tax=Buchnera aphidicola (Stegophylla sp.) TaxID=2315800 RepID=A0A4D6YEL3_9GAMM|nr:ATP-binding cassette domain-containing protein [Buchnera aphidicola (Stegophylla sp.)]QCI26453.1 ATP-binding cassette domain-containing protein [Buchnera aphidicola (Stegophylla sp.)]